MWLLVNKRKSRLKCLSSEEVGRFDRTLWKVQNYRDERITDAQEVQRSGDGGQLATLGGCYSRNSILLATVMTLYIGKTHGI